jgi:hypothetical protein
MYVSVDVSADVGGGVGVYVRLSGYAHSRWPL